MGFLVDVNQASWEVYEKPVFHRVFKKTFQQGRSERRGEAYVAVCGAPERCENAAGGVFNTLSAEQLASSGADKRKNSRVF